MSLGLGLGLGLGRSQVRERGFDTLVDVLAGNAGFFLGYNLMLQLTAGGWVV